MNKRHYYIAVKNQFDSPCTVSEGTGAFIGQMAKFYGGRVFTLIVEEAILFVFITKMGFNSVLIKVIAQVVVVVLNYLISKLLVFRKRAS